MRHTLRYIIIVLLASLPFSSAISADEKVRRPSARETETLLLERAEVFIYENLDSAEYYAGLVYSMSDLRSKQRIDAMNTLGRIAFFRMDYVQSEEIFSSILTRTKNRLEILNAEIWQMKICQRISDNISFYEYRNEALMNMTSISEESDAMTEEELKYFTRLQNDFRMVSALYYYELEQTAQAGQELSHIENNAAFKADTTLYLLYTYLRGMGIGVDNQDRREYVMTRMRSFENSLRVSSLSDNIKMQAMATRGIAELLLEPGVARIFYRSGNNLLDRLNSSDIAPELLPTQLTLKALQLFLQFDDTYEVIGCYRLLASCFIEREMYDEAIKYLTLALNMLNDKRIETYSDVKELPPLEPYRSDNEIVELEWLNKVPYATVPGCISAIREQMSLAYSGLDNKVMSDYNRNVYLELQKTLRLDRRYEARTQLLKRTNVRLFTSLYVVIIGIVFFIIFFLFFEKRIRRRNSQYISVLLRVMKLCETILRPLPAADSSIEELSKVVAPELTSLLGADSVELSAEKREDLPKKVMVVPLTIGSEENVAGYMHVFYSHRLSNDSKTILNTIVPYLATAINNANEMIGQEDRRRQIVKQHYLYQLHAEDNKRENLNRKTSCSVVNECLPYIDRMKSEISHLKADIKEGTEYNNRLQYISELSGRINDYNDLLSTWIKVQQGLVHPNIESFQLQLLFDIVNRGRSSYRMKGLTLDVMPTEAIVRADRVLTLFMINTLTDNAGKFTPSGGTITVSAVEQNDYVEITVSDTGIGLSAEDVQKIENEKVYDPDTIGSELSVKKKGSGFGLLNCKSIIEKYRRSDKLFEVCKLTVESEPGKGSRFSFRLPKGIRKSILMMIMLVGGAFGVQAQDIESDSLLFSAFSYAEKAYICNIDAKYDSALIYADSALMDLNSDYKLNRGNPQGRLMSLNGVGEPAETGWLQSGFSTDYETVLWLRNEVAVSALALRNWDLYRYNDDAYLKLFKLYYGESLIEQDCKMLQRSNSNLSIAIILFMMLLALFLIIHFVAYSRHWLRSRSDLQQVLRVVNRISESTAVSDTDHFDKSNILQHIVDNTFDEINHLFALQTIMLAMEEDGQIITATHTTEEFDERLKEHVYSSFQDGKTSNTSDMLCQALPLTVVQEGTQHIVGVFGIRLERIPGDTWEMPTDMIVRYLSAALYNCVVRIESGFRDIQQLQDEADRVRYEDGRLHVRNLILDNCLSTLKHETVYYPNRILQIVNSIDDHTDRESLISHTDDMYELVSYYREIFGILSQHATLQTVETLLRTQNISVNRLLEGAEAYFKKSKTDCTLRIERLHEDLTVLGDEVMLRYLLENLLGSAIRMDASQQLTLSASADGDFVRFSLYNHSVSLSSEELDQLFTPLHNTNDMAYPVCRQIIREHDEHFGHIGFRIVAEPVEEGYLIWFTILMKK